MRTTTRVQLVAIHTRRTLSGGAGPLMGLVRLGARRIGAAVITANKWATSLRTVLCSVIVGVLGVVATTAAKGGVVRIRFVTGTMFCYLGE